MSRKRRIAAVAAALAALEAAVCISTVVFGLDMFYGVLALFAGGFAVFGAGFGDEIGESMARDWREDEPDVVGDFLERRFGFRM